MASFNAKTISMWKEADKKSSYVKRVWAVDEDTLMTVKEYAEYVNPNFKDVTGNPEVIAVQKKDGNYFLKVQFTTKGGSIEYELPYNKDFSDCEPLSDYTVKDLEEGDILDLSSIRFGLESNLDKNHGFVIGKIAE